ncbi:MAG: cytochrome c [Williamsia sp.]|nr:cytochrome c [Williamsia sp.]
MKKLLVIILIVSAAATWAGCSDVRRDRGREYMPDMAYSRAYETYDGHEDLKVKNINYNATPVAGTIKRGAMFPFPIPMDKEGDSTNYVAARQVPNPFTTLTEGQAKEAERLYLINCAICHGTALDGNGPLYNGGNGPYPAAPKNLVADPVVSVMPEGQICYSVTYGKGQMGPYASNLRTDQRWMVVKYVKMKQLEKQGGKEPSAGAPTQSQQQAASSGGNQPGGGASGDNPKASGSRTPQPNQ